MSFKTLTGIGSDAGTWETEETEVRALTIVLNLERGSAISHEDVLLATAAGIRDYFLDMQIREGGIWHEQTAKWMDGRIRKLAKRARGSEWAAITELPGVLGSYADAVVRVLPPVLVEEIPRSVKKLQTQGLDLPSETPLVDFKADILLAVNPNINMTTGKTMAQIGHATQLAIMRASDAQLTKWKLQPPTISLIPFTTFGKWDIEVHDAGFTEVESNALTVVAQLT